MDGRYYWLKLKRDFFKRHDIRIIEAMPNGKDYILFYLKLLCESVDHDGRLRFSDQIPYNAEMLAVITDTNKDIVTAAVKMFTELGMMELMDDGTFYMTECEKMIGSETSSAQKVREWRERKALQCEDNKITTELHCNRDVITTQDQSKSKNKNKNINNNSEIAAEFDEVWNAYPRKERRQDALKAYIKARSEGTDKETILNGIARYKAKIAAQKTDAKYIAQGGTWFAQRRWEDEYEKGETYERRIDASIYEEVYQ